MAASEALTEEQDVDTTARVAIHPGRNTNRSIAVENLVRHSTSRDVDPRRKRHRMALS